MTFNALGLSEQITRSLHQEGYTTPTPIQTQAIPVVLAGRDLIGIAQTGTGKTAAFALPILNMLAQQPRALTPKGTRVLVLSPTRELSAQIKDSFRTYGRHLRLSVTLAIGGTPIGKQIRALAPGVDVLVATPGRLLDLCQSRALVLDGVEFLVLDEADRMLDMGFVRDIRRIVAMLPKKRQTLFFSATMPGEIAELAGEMLTNPARVSVAPPTATADRVEQRVFHVDRGDKPALLADILKRETSDRVLVFTRTKHGADRVVRGLVQSGIPAEAIHGDKSQGQRERVLAAFRNGKVRTLVATDIAARGIDVDGISHVINFDLPNIAESYVHRIGRTARAGNAGIAISLCAGDEAAFLRDIEKLIRQSIPVAGGTPRPERPPQKQGGQRPGGHQQAKPRQGRGRPQHRHSQAKRHEPVERRQLQSHGNTKGGEIGGVGFLKPARRGQAERAGA
ncbi:MAG TPA: DEAD/DEAH box helicase [Bauldia sp.]|nr:DEAD/DEAH box helicase [Bauldia sp.]